MVIADFAPGVTFRKPATDAVAGEYELQFDLDKGGTKSTKYSLGHTKVSEISNIQCYKGHSILHQNSSEG